MGVLHVRLGGHEPCGDGDTLFRRDPGSREADVGGGRRLRREPGGDRHEIVGGGSGGGGHHAGGSGDSRAGGGGGTHSGERGQGRSSNCGGPRTGDEPARINRRGGEHGNESRFVSGPTGDARDQKGGNKPFAGIKILLLDYSIAEDQNLQDYEHMVEVLGGVPCNPAEYSSSTHIAVMGTFQQGLGSFGKMT
ncbi:keratin, type I cytoskeletal 9 [Brachypodium distachyon]|uniref:keratin, type I cytoskeletal 9 n=1 Tax=Brachypodium distachyon TaxID=15368 RepID=UPI000D0CAA56|nr:keratin, type I cytoskeletal 9 [Brachypodium distachyon]|eukprot:XP_024316103.1 keratin, type I cytoskeletal 9 [Brachypodium distachyon]